ncbi:MAG: response regulator [Patescibacteria group bacterium]
MSKKILIVDDDELLRRSIVRMLRRALGMELLIVDVASAFKALSEWNLAVEENEPFGLVLSDMRMPGMDGSELYTQLRARGLDMRRFMLMSGHMDSRQASFVREEGIVLLEKPFDPKKLLELVQNILAS